MNLGLHEYWTVIRQRLAIIIFIPILAALACGWYSYEVAQPLYVATATLLLDTSANATPPDATTLDGLVKSQVFDDAVIASAGLSISGRSLGKMLSTDLQGELLSITVLADSEPIAAQVANATANTFQQEAKTLMNVAAAQVVDKATALDNATPASPKKLQNIAIAFVFGLLLALGITFLMEYLDLRLKSEGDMMKHLQIPLLASIEEYKMGR